MSKQSKTKTGWVKSKVHEDITLPSGFKVDIELPNIPSLIKAGALPNELVEVATKAAVTNDIPEDMFEKMDDFNNYLVSVTVVNPKITPEDVKDLPSEDIDMLVGFATRTRDMDAVGHHIAGLETIKSFREFRGLTPSSEGLFGS